MNKSVYLIFGAITLISCSSMPRELAQIQLLESNSTLINNCTNLGPIYTDTRGGPHNFDFVAEQEFRRIAYENYKADSAVITSRSPHAFGRVVLQGTALRCY